MVFLSYLLVKNGFIVDNQILYIIGAIFFASLGTAITRFLPFFLLKDRVGSPLLKYLQDTMPLLIMALLVFFTLKDIPWRQTYASYVISGILCAIVCFLLFKNSVLSIFSGIIFYLLVIRIF